MEYFTDVLNVNDGTNEGLNYIGKKIYTVQFHPEALTVAGDSISARFFHFLVDKATAFRRSK